MLAEQWRVAQMELLADSRELHRERAVARRSDQRMVDRLEELAVLELRQLRLAVGLYALVALIWLSKPKLATAAAGGGGAH